MTAAKFVAWLEGIAEGLGDTPPTPEQWARIRERLAEVGPPKEPRLTHTFPSAGRFMDWDDVATLNIPAE